jgi:hypothetical protein
MPTAARPAPDRSAANLVDDALDKALAAADAGVRQVWLDSNWTMTQSVWPR